eukprot:33599-Prorocentrum_minimum.AAC.1
MKIQNRNGNNKKAIETQSNQRKSFFRSNESSLHSWKKTKVYKGERIGKTTRVWMCLLAHAFFVGGPEVFKRRVE